jgi:TolB-like protein
MSFFSELKRRHVVKVAVTYAIVAWLLIEIAATLLPAFAAPDWVLRVVVLLLAIGFVIALVLSWIYDLTPTGTERTDSAEATGHPITANQKLNALVIGALVLAVLFLGVDRYLDEPTPEAEPVAAESDASTATNTIADLTRERHSIAVLPFANESAAEENAEFFANGIHHDILTQLAKINSLSVISQTSVEAYRDSPKLMSQIGEELGATSIVEGLVQRAGDMVRINVQLIDSATDEHLWAEIYNSELTVDNIFEIQASVATNIAAALEAELLPAELERIERVSTGSTEALELYWRARALVPNINMVPPPEFHDLLDQAIELDPEFALAYALKGVEYAFMMRRGDPVLSVVDREALARGYAEKALDLDPDTGLAHFALGTIAQFRWRGAEALAAHQRALELAPNDFDILDDFSRVASALGRHEEAIALGQRAAELSRGNAGTALAYAYLRADRPDDAEAAVTNADTVFGGQLGLYIALARGDEADLLEWLRVGEEELLSETNAARVQRLCLLIYGYGRLGQSDKAAEYFSSIDFEAFPEGSWYFTYLRLLVYLGVGDAERALEFVNRIASRQNVQGGLDMLIANNTLLDPILDTPRFVEARSRIVFTAE